MLFIVFNISQLFSILDDAISHNNSTREEAGVQNNIGQV